jgi:hypothetical protein
MGFESNENWSQMSEETKAVFDVVIMCVRQEFFLCEARLMKHIEILEKKIEKLEKEKGVS